MTNEPTDQEQHLLATMKAVEECPVRGHIKYLDDKRFVFIGQNPEKPDTWFLGFRNAEEEDTKLALSREAYEALAWMFTAPFKGERVKFPYVVKTVWTVVMKEERETE